MCFFITSSTSNCCAAGSQQTTCNKKLVKKMLKTWSGGYGSRCLSVICHVCFFLQDMKTMKLYCMTHDDLIRRIGELMSSIISLLWWWCEFNLWVKDKITNVFAVLLKLNSHGCKETTESNSGLYMIWLYDLCNQCLRKFLPLT